MSQCRCRDGRARNISGQGRERALSAPALGGGGYGVPPGGGLSPGSEIPPFPSVPDGEDVRVSLVFVGMGDFSHDVQHVYGPCGDGSTDCQTLWVANARDASAVLTMTGEGSAPGTGRLTYDKSIQAAAPKPVDGEY